MSNVTQPTPRSPASRQTGDGWEARRARFSEREAKWLEKHQLKCEAFAEARALVAQRGVMLAGWSMMKDPSGAEIERHLATLAEPYVRRVVAAAWDVDGDGEPRRNWTHWAARAIAVVAWFLAVQCQATELHGRPVWRVSGFSMRFFAMLTSAFVWRGGKELRITPHRSTLGHVSRKRGGPAAPPRGWLGALVRVGLLEAHQFAAHKVQAHERGERRWNPRTQQWEQWAFNQMFLLVCPFEAGETKPRPLGKRAPSKHVVRRVTDSVLHRQRRNAIRRAEEAAARERARLDAAIVPTDHPAISPLDRVAVEAPAPATSSPSSPAPAASGGEGWLAGLRKWSPEALARYRRVTSIEPQ